MSQVKLIIFDFNGVTVHGGHRDTMKVLGERYGLDPQELYDVFYTKYHNLVALKKISVREAWEAPLKHFGIDLPWEEALQIHLNISTLNAEICSLADQLRAAGCRCVVVSKNVKEYWEQYLARFHFDRHFDEVINLQDYGLPKASLETLQFLLDRYQARPEQIVYIDDQQENLAIPEKHGVHTILYESFDQVQRDVRATLV